MSVDFQSIDPYKIDESIFRLVGKDWMLITAGTTGSYNMMTASWGGCGVLWNKPVAIIFVRPQRYTFDFIEKHDHFTLSFFGTKYKDILTMLGTNSGRDIEKMSTQGLRATTTPKGNVFFEEARIVMECRKLYYDDIKPEFFLDKAIHKMYPSRDYHRIYIGEVIHALKREHNH
ncbi:MAG: flavin reductase family protein [Bacteroidota bacterium]